MKLNMQDSNALVLEVLRQGNELAMSVFEKKEVASTLRHYSQLPFPLPEINRLCHDVAALLNKASPVRNTEAPGSLASLKKAGQLLWDRLLAKSVKDKLRGAAIRDLVLSLDERLINIPWELLYDGDDFLCLKFNLGRSVRTKERANLSEYRSLPGKLKMLILANPTNDLKSAYLEGTQIKNQFDRRRNEISIDFKSTHIDTLYLKKNLRDYDIVHFAGHCEYDSRDPKDTGWILSDGNFTPQDILTMGETLPLPALIFSNACHSAEVNPDSLSADYQVKTYSLASAFLFSGTRHYIGTVRKIEDPPSFAFAKEFYTQLINGNSVGGCMRCGRLKLIKEYGINNIPWASYLLYGDPNFALFRPKKKPAASGFKINLSLSKSRKLLLRLLLAAGVISVSIYLYMWLPTLNPDTYFLFLQSRRLFSKGANQEAVLTLNNILRKEPLFLATYPLLADTYQRLGRRNEALKIYFDYALFAQKKQDNQKLACAYIGIGWVYQLQGEYPKAFDFYNQAISLSRKSKDKLNEAVALRKLAVWYTNKEDYDKALELLLKSSEINRESQHSYEHRYNLACDYFDIGLIFSDKEDFTTAKEFYGKSLALFEKLKLKNELSDYYFNMGEIYLFEKQYQRALDYYRRGLKLDELQGNQPNIASDYNMLGELYVEMGNLTEAEKFFNQSISISKQIDDQPELACGYHNLGFLYKKKGRPNKAKEYLRLAQEIYSRIDTPDYQRIKKEFSDLD